MSKKLYLCIKVTMTVLLIITFISAIMIFGPILLNCQRYKINSASMSPVLRPGDIIYVRPVKPEDLEQGDIITFRSAESNLIVTHRICRIDFDARLIYTKGDMNTHEDAEPVLFSHVIGQYTNYKIPNLFDNNKG